MKILLILVAVIVLVDLAESKKKSVRLEFKAAKIIDDIVDDKEYELVTVNYGPKKVLLGNNLTETDTSTKPTFDFKYRANKYYALLMTDPDVPSPTISLPGEFFHWFVGNIPGDRSSSGEDILSYFPPIPPPGTEPHRYTFLLYQQPKKFNFSDGSLLGVDLINRLFRRARDLASKLNLGEPIAGNFFYKGFKPSCRTWSALCNLVF